jgi:hypothetical protein
MNPLFAAILGSFIRWGLTILATWLVEHGVWSSGDSATYVTGLTLGAVTLAWSLWSRYKSRIKFLTALELPSGSSEQYVNETIAKGKGATL